MKYRFMLSSLLSFGLSYRAYAAFPVNSSEAIGPVATGEVGGSQVQGIVFDENDQYYLVQLFSNGESMVIEKAGAARSDRLGYFCFWHYIQGNVCWYGARVPERVPNWPYCTWKIRKHCLVDPFPGGIDGLRKR